MKELLTHPWPWYISGPLIGLTAPALLVLGNKQFGISSTLKDFCAMCVPSLSKPLNANLKENAWNLFFVAGIFIGSVINYFWFQNPEPVKISEQTISDLHKMGLTNLNGLVPSEIFNWNNLLQFQAILFIVIGGFLVGFGTRYGGGCTSGHGILGLATLNFGSLLAVIGFFIGGLTMVHLIFPLLYNNLR